MTARLREIIEAAAQANARMIEIGEGYGALPESDRDALDRYDGLFAVPGPAARALLDAAAFVVDDFLFGCEDQDGNLTAANLEELRDRAIELRDRLSEVAP